MLLRQGLVLFVCVYVCVCIVFFVVVGFFWLIPKILEGNSHEKFRCKPASVSYRPAPSLSSEAFKRHNEGILGRGIWDGSTVENCGCNLAKRIGITTNSNRESTPKIKSEMTWHLPDSYTQRRSTGTKGWICPQICCYPRECARARPPSGRRTCFDFRLWHLV